MNCRFFSILLFASGLLFDIHPQHRVGGVLEGVTHWTADRSPYLIVSDILIPRMSKLMIEPGTRIEIASGPGEPTRIRQIDQADSGSISIKVEGTLLCSGRATKMIRFAPTEFHENCGWYGIVFRKSGVDTSFISQTEITGAFNGITVWKCRPTIHHSIIERNNVGINCLQGGSATVSNCIISGNFTAAIHIDRANPVIENCLILHNRGYGFWGDGISAAAVVYNCFFDNTDGNFQDCDPALGRFVVKKIKGAPADTFNNLFGDPIFAGTEADSIALARALANQPKPKKILNIKLPRFLQPAPVTAGITPNQTKPPSRYALSPFSPCIGTGKKENGSVCNIGINEK